MEDKSLPHFVLENLQLQKQQVGQKTSQCFHREAGRTTRGSCVHFWVNGMCSRLDFTLCYGKKQNTKEHTEPPKHSTSAKILPLGSAPASHRPMFRGATWEGNRQEHASDSTGCPFPSTAIVTLWLCLLFYLFSTLPKLGTLRWSTSGSVAFQPRSPTLPGCRELLCPELILHEHPGTRGGRDRRTPHSMLQAGLAHAAGRQGTAAAS